MVNSERYEWLRSSRTEKDSRAAATCAECGGKYRPAGGPCIHEFPNYLGKSRYEAHCGQCGERWRPGHSCLVSRPAMQADIARNREILKALGAEARRLADEEPGVLDPENWD